LVATRGSDTRGAWDRFEEAQLEWNAVVDAAMREMDGRVDDPVGGEARLLSTADAAARLGVSSETIRERHRRGELAAYGTTGKLRFLWPDVLDCFRVRPARHREPQHDARRPVESAPRPAVRSVRRFKTIDEEGRVVA
jgi:excisionase family DNA binding protein